MESLYYVLSWLCHRRCEHCYEDRFRPYYGADLEQVVGEARGNFARIVGNFPKSMVFRDWNDGLREKRGRVILAGGEVLLEAVRESVLYPVLELLWSRYEGQVKLIVQTTGDLLTQRLARELVDRHVWMISISGMDEFHDGIDPVKAEARLKAMLDGMGFTAGQATEETPGPHYHFFGATPGSWIGKLWPRGRAWSNGLSTATLGENFCNRWSGGLNFLQRGYSGSEVAIDPAGNVYPCCMKTKLALGSLLEEPLEAILDRCEGNPVYEAISMGHPERMGIAAGWSVEEFLRRSMTESPTGEAYQNLCIGCDRFHEEVLGPKLVQLR